MSQLGRNLSRAGSRMIGCSSRNLMTSTSSKKFFTSTTTKMVGKSSVIGIQLPISTRHMSSSTTSSPETMSFQAETRKLLDIVTHSIYTDKEVFVRELISNASDALEKFRYFQVSGTATAPTNSGNLEIRLIADPVANTLTLIDNGVGMSREELVKNLGTIARSGSKAFIEQLKNGENAQNVKTDGIIGQFGVGFYSSFMVADSVTVESISAVDGEPKLHKWSSDGSGVFTIEEVDNPENIIHGSKIVMKLKDSCKEFSDPDRIKSIIKHYSSFVSFPIKVNDETINTVSAIWTLDKSQVTEEQYNDFYKFVANAYDTPKMRLHFRTDAPIDLKCLLYVPSFHQEKFGGGITELGVNLYSRKVLIESKPRDLLPEWLRFVKGVVDSEDLPLSLSREKPQDSNLLRRIREVLTRKLIKSFETELKNNRREYQEFFIEYQMFLKQGVCYDYKSMDMLAKLLLFESSHPSSVDELVTLDEYVSRCAPEQKDIYYLVASNREAALKSPYYEIFKKHNKEVLFLYNDIDDFVMANLKEFGGRKLVSAETSDIKFDGDDSMATAKLSDTESKDMCEWLKTTLGSKVSKVEITTRLADSPAIIVGHESGALRRMMRMVEQANNGREADNYAVPPQVLEINVGHPLIVELFKMKDDPNAPSHLVAEQLFDNCLISAGLVDDVRSMLPRLNEILLASLKK